MQADEVAHIGVEAHVGQADLLDQPHRRVRGAEVGVLVQLQGEEDADLGSMAAQFAKPVDSERPHRRIIGIDVPLGRPEPEPGALLLGERLMQSDRDDREVERRRGIDRAVAICQVGVAVLRVDHAAAHDGRRLAAEAGFADRGCEVRQRGCVEIARPHPAVGDVDEREPGVGDVLEVAQPAVGTGRLELQHRRGDRPVGGGVSHSCPTIPVVRAGEESAASGCGVREERTERQLGGADRQEVGTQLRAGEPDIVAQSGHRRRPHGILEPARIDRVQRTQEAPSTISSGLKTFTTLASARPR